MLASEDQSELTLPRMELCDAWIDKLEKDGLLTKRDRQFIDEAKFEAKPYPGVNYYPASYLLFDICRKLIII